MKIGSRALDLLVALVERAGRVVTKDELMSQVWPNVIVEDTNIRVNICNLRRCSETMGSMTATSSTSPGGAMCLSPRWGSCRLVTVSLDRPVGHLSHSIARCEEHPTMLAARMVGYQQPLVLEEVGIPEITADQVLVRIGGVGMCYTDVELLDGYFRDIFELSFPITPGHEIAGVVAVIGEGVPAAMVEVGDQVVVAGGWGDGTCRQCRRGNEQLCDHAVYPGFGPAGGYAEYIAVPARQLIRIEKKLAWEELAPLTDAGVTPYRGVKKLRAAGVLGPDRVVAVIGAGGLGGYAVQYARLLSYGATVVVFDRNDEKLAISRLRGADVAINTHGRSVRDLEVELLRSTGKRRLDAVIDCVGAEETLRMAFGLLAKGGMLVTVGLMGTRIDVPLFPTVAGELTYQGSNWANYADLQEVVTLAQRGQIQHSVTRVRLENVNETLELLRAGEVIGRAVIVFDV